MKTLLILPVIFALVVTQSFPVYGSQQNGEITEVSFERKGCNGFCPVDIVTFRRNGSHTYTGIRYVDRIGNYRVDQREYKFDVLVKVLERVNYADLNEDYGRGTFDAQVIILRVARGGKNKTVASYDPERTPIELVIISSFIENIVPKIRWKKVV